VIKRSIFESSEGGRTDVTYSDLTVRQLDQRIKSYEQKYGMPFPRYKRQFSCDDALPWEVSDYMDWENLLQERTERQRASKKLTSSKA
jgi:hypothetical protein